MGWEARWDTARYSRTSLLRTPFTTFSPIQRTNSKVPNFRNALYMLPVSFTAYTVTRNFRYNVQVSRENMKNGLRYNVQRGSISAAPLAPNSQRTRVAQNNLPSNSQRGAGTLTISRCIVLHVGIRSSPVIDLITLIHS